MKQKRATGQNRTQERGQFMERSRLPMYRHPLVRSRLILRSKNYVSRQALIQPLLNLSRIR